MKQPQVITFNDIEMLESNTHERKSTDGFIVWVPARPIGSPSFWNRVKLAIGVFTGKYDVFKWPCDQ
jgi:hypothetical protein